MEYGFFALIHLAVVIYALINIMSSGASTGSKLLWIILVAALPVVGLIVWLLAGPRGRSSNA